MSEHLTENNQQPKAIVHIDTYINRYPLSLDDPLAMLILGATREEIRKRTGDVPLHDHYEILPSALAYGGTYVQARLLRADAEVGKMDFTLVDADETDMPLLVPTDTVAEGGPNNGYLQIGVVLADLFQLDELGQERAGNLN